MRILLVHNDYQQVGGEEAAVKAQLALLSQHGHQVVLYHRDNSEIEGYGVLEKAIFFSNTLYSRKTYSEVRALVATEKPDLAHVHNVFPLISPSVYEALHDAGVPIVQTLHNFRLLCPNALFYTHGKVCERCKFGNTIHAVRWKCYRQSYPLSALYGLSIGWHRYRRTFQYIDHFIALTAFGAQKLQESRLATQEQISVLGNFLADPLPMPGSTSLEQPYFLYLGRLSPEKGVDILIDAMQGVTGLRLKIVGDGPQASELKERVWGNDQRQVEFLGYISGDKKWELIRNALAVVVPSTCYENFPVTVLEGFATATPVIASNQGSLPHIIEDGKNGLLFQPGSVRSLNKKLQWAAAHPDAMLAMGKYGRQLVESRYSVRAFYDELIRIYSTVVR